MKKVLIAVVTPVYNGEKTIEKSIKSLLVQTFTDWVNIIVNDGSTDLTREVLKKYESDKRFIIIHLENNQGRGFARQKALEKVLEINAKYMCMLDADDLYYPDKLEWQYDYMESNPDITLLSCSVGLIDNNCNLKRVFESYKEENKFYFEDIRNYIPVNHASSIVKVENVGNTMFDFKMKFSEDQEFMMRLLKGRKYGYLPKIGYLYDKTTSFSFRKYKQSILSNIYLKRKLGFNELGIFNSYLKIFVVFWLFIFNLQYIYIRKITRKPNYEEMNYHQKILVN